jgi:hypothetical protein
LWPPARERHAGGPWPYAARQLPEQPLRTQPDGGYRGGGQRQPQRPLRRRGSTDSGLRAGRLSREARTYRCAARPGLGARRLAPRQIRLSRPKGAPGPAERGNRTAARAHLVQSSFGQSGCGGHVASLESQERGCPDGAEGVIRLVEPETGGRSERLSGQGAGFVKLLSTCRGFALCRYS